MARIDIVCNSCNGTGIYVGACERDGAGVICRDCNGTGNRMFEFTPFIVRARRSDVKRVYESSQGFVISAEMHSEFGCTYEEWLNGQKPKMLELSCPFLATYQEYKCETIKHEWVGYIPKCKNWENRAKCWKEYKESIKHE